MCVFSPTCWISESYIRRKKCYHELLASNPQHPSDHYLLLINLISPSKIVSRVIVKLTDLGCDSHHLSISFLRFLRVLNSDLQSNIFQSPGIKSSMIEDLKLHKSIWFSISLFIYLVVFLIYPCPFTHVHSTLLNPWIIFLDTEDKIKIKVGTECSAFSLLSVTLQDLPWYPCSNTYKYLILNLGILLKTIKHSKNIFPNYF